jgi:hypothetical protein
MRGNRLKRSEQTSPPTSEGNIPTNERGARNSQTPTPNRTHRKPNGQNPGGPPNHDRSQREEDGRSRRRRRRRRRRHSRPHPTTKTGTSSYSQAGRPNRRNPKSMNMNTQTGHRGTTAPQRGAYQPSKTESSQTWPNWPWNRNGRPNSKRTPLDTDRPARPPT